MKELNVKVAELEARRFLDRAKALREAVAKFPEGSPEACWSFLPPLESGALRRASMDLTRALAKMRRTG